MTELCLSLGMFKSVIYSISEPLTNEVRYIGKTDTNNSRETPDGALAHRMIAHYIETCNKRKYSWIKALEVSGYEPVFTILDVCNADIGMYVERKRIYEHLQKCCDLFNIKYSKPLFMPVNELSEIADGFVYWID